MTQTGLMDKSQESPRSGVRAWVALAVVTALMSSCGEDEGSVLNRSETNVLVGAEGDGEEPMAGVGVGGTVTLVGNCLGIGRAIVIWPYGTEIVDEDPFTIDVPDFGEVSVGDSIQGGGDTYVDYLPDGIDEVPSGCPDDEVFAFYPDP